MKLKVTKDANNARKFSKKLLRKGWIEGIIGALGIGICACMIERGANNRTAAISSNNFLDNFGDIEVPDTWDEDHNVK